MTAKTTLDQIDELLLAWDERLRRMDENLVALESEAIYQILAGKAGKRPALEGLTKQRVGPALDAVTELFENRERLTAIVEAAKEVRGSMSALAFWEHDDKTAEILRLLRGNSIELSPRVIALSERSLLDESQRDVFVQPEQLLAAMVGRFEEARRTLLAVSRAWESLEPEMEQIEKDMATLRALGAELAPKTGGPFVAEKPPELQELSDAEAELGHLRTRVAKDPLGAEGGVKDGITPRLSALAARLTAAVTGRRRVLAALDEARALKQRLDEDHTRAQAAVARARQAVEGPSVDRLPAPLDDGLIEGLADWLHKLEAKVAGHRWSPAEVGLARFRETARREQATEASTIAAAEALIARPEELGGRLSARRAQAAALTARGLALDPAAEAHARTADALLRRRPVPLDELSRAVEAYEAGVIALAARR